MNDDKIYSIEKKYGVLGVNSEAKGLCYFVDPFGLGLVIASDRGIIGLTATQTVHIATELPGIVDVFLKGSI